LIASGRQSGFTLIEIAVVLVLMALLATVTAVSARGMIGGATQQEVLAQIQSLDAQARRHAQETGRSVSLELDTTTNRLTLTQDQQQRAVALAQYELPRGYTLGQAWRWRGDARDMQTRIAVTYDPHGVAPTWGVTLAGIGSDQPTSLLVLGSTGQTTFWENDGQVQDILSQNHRRDTD